MAFGRSSRSLAQLSLASETLSSTAARPPLPLRLKQTGHLCLSPGRAPTLFHKKNNNSDNHQWNLDPEYSTENFSIHLSEWLLV